MPTAKMMVKYQGSHELQQAWFDALDIDMIDIAKIWQDSIFRLTQLMNHNDPKISLEASKRLSYLLQDMSKLSAEGASDKKEEPIILRANPFTPKQANGNTEGQEET